MWLITFFDSCRLWLWLWGMVAFEMQFLLLSLYGTGWLRTVRYGLRHTVKTQTYAEQHESEDDGQKELGVPGGKTLDTGGSFVKVQGMGETLSCRYIPLVSLLVIRVILIRNLLPEQNFLESHNVYLLIV